jgi:hypothetical protein
MEVSAYQTLSDSSFFTAIAVLIGLACGILAFMILSRRYTVPSGSWMLEGFQGPSNGVSDISCGQESAHAIAISELFSGKMSVTEEGSADLKELKLILSKLCCLKHDLMSASQSVQGMLYLPYSNTHDRENPADVAGRCFTKSIPARDLDIAFGTWKERGLFLVNRLCTSYNLVSSESDTVVRHFKGLWIDVFSIAKNGCLVTKEDPVYESPRDPKGHVPEDVEELGPYKGYY